MPQQIVEKSSTIKFHDNPPSERRVVLCRRTDRHEANSHLHNLVNAPENWAGCPTEVPETKLTKIM